MKKVVNVLAVAAMLVAVAACGNKKAEEAPAEEPVEVIEEVVDTTVAEVADTTAVEVVAE